jgi:hypothetical protein
MSKLTAARDMDSSSDYWDMVAEMEDDRIDAGETQCDAHGHFDCPLKGCAPGDE